VCGERLGCRCGGRDGGGCLSGESSMCVCYNVWTARDEVAEGGKRVWMCRNGVSTYFLRDSWGCARWERQVRVCVDNGVWVWRER